MREIAELPPLRWKDVREPELPAVAREAALVAPKGPVLRDERTGLDWQRHVEPLALERTQARRYCARLGLAGAEPWRLPSLDELRTFAAVHPSDGTLWAADWAVADQVGWQVHGNGAADRAAPGERAGVRCVRGRTAQARAAGNP